MTCAAGRWDLAMAASANTAADDAPVGESGESGDGESAGRGEVGADANAGDGDAAAISAISLSSPFAARAAEAAGGGGGSSSLPE